MADFAGRVDLSKNRKIRTLLIALEQLDSSCYKQSDEDIIPFLAAPVMSLGNMGAAIFVVT